jgi:hypothetical protein
MSSRLLVPLALISAFILGSIVSGPASNAFVGPQSPAPSVATSQAFVPVQPVAPRLRPAARFTNTVATTPVKKKRTWQKEALIIGGGAGAGVAVGAIAGGKKGAAIGGVSGGIAAAIYDLATRNK